MLVTNTGIINMYYLMGALLEEDKIVFYLANNEKVKCSLKKSILDFLKKEDDLVEFSHILFNLIAKKCRFADAALPDLADEALKIFKKEI